MAWVVDTCVVIDVLEADPEFGMRSAKLLKKFLPEGLLLCPVTFVELSPAFAGDLVAQKNFCELAGLGFGEPTTVLDSETAHTAWNRIVLAKRRKNIGKRPVAEMCSSEDLPCGFRGLSRAIPTISARGSLL